MYQIFFMNLNIRSFNANGELFESVLNSLIVSPKVIISTENCKIDGYTTPSEEDVVEGSLFLYILV